MRLRCVSNFRDLGGYPAADGQRVRPGRLYRSGHLAAMTGEDRRRLEAAGIRLVVDLRSDHDISQDGGHAPLRGARRLHLEAFGAMPAVPDLRSLMLDGDSRRQFEVLGQGRAQALMIRALLWLAFARAGVFSLFLQLMADARTLPAIVHCSAGKDRTGWAVALLLLALGVEERVVIEDYVRSNEHREEELRMASSGLGGRIDSRLVLPLFEARPEYLLATWDTIRKRFGSLEAYLAVALKVSPSRAARLRANFLE